MYCIGIVVVLEHRILKLNRLQGLAFVELLQLLGKWMILQTLSLFFTCKEVVIGFGDGYLLVEEGLLDFAISFDGVVITLSTDTSCLLIFDMLIVLKRLIHNNLLAIHDGCVQTVLFCFLILREKRLTIALLILIHLLK